MLQIPAPKVETANFEAPAVVWTGNAAKVAMTSLSDGGEGHYNVYVKNTNYFYDYYCQIAVTPGEDSRTLFVGGMASSGVGLAFYGNEFVPESSAGTNTITKIVKMK